VHNATGKKDQQDKNQNQTKPPSAQSHKLLGLPKVQPGKAAPRSM